MKVVAFVPIKLNSERLANKNILPLGDHCVSWYIFNTLSNVPNIDEIYVYCSNELIKNFIPSNIKFLKRPDYLDNNTTLGIQIYTEFIGQVDADIYILAHTTSPFISTDTISNSLNMILNNINDSALTVTKHQKFAWYEDCPLNYNPYNVIRTQDLKPIYLETSAFYMFKKDTLLLYKRRYGCTPYLAEINYLEAVDIDTKEDYDMAVFMLPLYIKTLKTLTPQPTPEIKTVILDFDGTMSDGKIICTIPPIKSYNVKDGYIINKLSPNIRFILLSGNDLTFFKNTKLNKKLRIKEIHGKCHDKLKLIKSLKCDLTTTLYIGDDDNDIEAMKVCKIKACPKNASTNVLKISNYISQFNGGEGAVRDILEHFCSVI